MWLQREVVLAALTAAQQAAKKKRARRGYGRFGRSHSVSSPLLRAPRFLRNVTLELVGDVGWFLTRDITSVEMLAWGWERRDTLEKGGTELE